MRAADPPTTQPASGSSGHARGAAEGLEARILAEAHRLGFALAAIVPARDARTHSFYTQWLAQGHAGRMEYLHRHAPLKAHPRHVLEGVRSVLVLGHAYGPGGNDHPGGSSAPGDTGTDTPPPLHGRISRYALGADYHDVLRAKLERLGAFVEAAAGGAVPVPWRACVDSAPLMERELAASAGQGWVGRNAMFIHRKLGSWLFLCELLLGIALKPTEPTPPGKTFRAPPDAHPWPPREHGGPWPPREHCGTCTACITACPTGAIVADKTVDSRRCISYLTIELKGPVPEELRPGMGGWVFGCDVCQQVCPWNRRAPAAQDAALCGTAELALPHLPGLLALDDAAFRERYRHTPLWRPRRRGVLRNAAVALGNRLAAERDPLARAEGLAALQGALTDAEPLVRGAAAWAIGRAAPTPGEAPAIRVALLAALEAEHDADALGEMRAVREGLEALRASK